jgi:hypothetical protein
VTLVLAPRKLTAFFALAVLALTCAHLAGLYCNYVLDHDSGLVALFDTNREENVPTFFSAAAWLAGALLAGVIGAASRQAGRPGALHWIGLALLLVFLAMDEMLSLHERLTDRVNEVIDTTGLFRYAWVLPYGLFAAVLAGLYAPFLLRLPRRTRNLLLVSGGLLGIGGLGLEVLGGVEAVLHDDGTITASLLATAEELVEMTGVVVLLHALASYIDLELGELRIAISSGRAH